MQRMNPPLVVIAFNRPNSLRRLLGSLNNAYYPEDGVTLIISIDKDVDNQNVVKVAEDFLWEYGDKKVQCQSENLGLRKHVIHCASHCDMYGSVILLEDDLFVSPQFYNYACQALEFSLDKDYIGGVSLYNHQFNAAASSNFSPIEDGYDNWYFQYASSWGQAWTKEQWNDFMNWYSQNDELSFIPSVPENVTRWSNKSWLKYFIYYLVETNKYFLYPKISLSTNFSDAGTHMHQDSTKYQVPLDYSQHKIYTFSEYSNSRSTYDSFYENTKLYEALQLRKEMLCVDLYGSKPITSPKYQYLLSTRIYDFKIMDTFGCKMKPIDTNILNKVDGSDIFLYDTSERRKNNNKNSFLSQTFYNIKYISRRDAKKLFVHMYYQRFRKFLKDKFPNR